MAAAYVGEQALFRERAHERSIVFHIARHLAALVNEELPGWSVDVEYDRMHPEELIDVKKRMWRAARDAEEAGAEVSEQRENDVYPDVIVHRRSGLAAEHDLLVVEVNKEETPGHQEDRAKLRGFLEEPFCYQHAAFLVLPRDGGMPHCDWIGRAEP